MRAIIEPPPEADAKLGPLWKRLCWFVGLAIAGACATMAVAYLLKAMLR